MELVWKASRQEVTMGLICKDREFFRKAKRAGRKILGSPVVGFLGHFTIPLIFAIS